MNDAKIKQTYFSKELPTMNDSCRGQWKALRYYNVLTASEIFGIEISREEIICHGPGGQAIEDFCQY